MSLTEPPAPSTWRERIETLPVPTLPALLAVAVFAGTLGNGIVFDDVWTLGRLDDVSKAPVETLLRSGRSFTYLTHRIDQWLWAGATWGPHLTNLALHALATALVALLAQRLTASRRVGLVCGLLFAIHPVHVEAVASISNRKDILAMIFGAILLILWQGRSRPWLRYPAMATCLALALYSKEVAAVGIVPMLFLTDLLDRGDGEPWRPKLRRALVRIAPLLVAGLAAAIWFATHVSLDSAFAAIRHESNEQINSYAQVLATAFAAVPDIGRLLVWPATLSADYPLNVQLELFTGPAVAGMLIVLAWIVSAAFLCRRAPLVAFAMAWVLITYLPASNVVPLTHFFVAERYLYVPSLGVCLAVALGVDRLALLSTRSRDPSLRKLGVGLMVILIMAGGLRSVLRAHDWRSGSALWTSALQAGFETRRIHGHFAQELFTDGRREASLLHYQRAYDLHTCTEEALYLAQAQAAVGRDAEAAQGCRRILELEPGNRQARALLKSLKRRAAHPDR